MTRSIKQEEGKPARREGAVGGSTLDVGAGKRPGPSTSRRDSPRDVVCIVASQTRVHSRWAVVLLSAASLGLCCLVFPRPNWWPLAYVCMTPWLFAVCTSARPRLLYWVSYLFGAAYFVFNIAWMIQVTIPGYVALCLAYSAFFPLAAWPIRHLSMRRGVPVAVSAAVLWTATEYLRSIGTLGFPWLLLAHSQYQVLSIIQISDLTGAYGVSFVIMMVNGWIVDLLIQPIRVNRAERKARLPIGTLATALVVLGALAYGGAQKLESHLVPGPTVAVIQHDDPLSVDPRRVSRIEPEVLSRIYLDLCRRAVAAKPDLILLPETASPYPINQEFLDATPDELRGIYLRRYGRGRDYSESELKRQVAGLEYLQVQGRRTLQAYQQLSNESGASIVLGTSTLAWKPDGQQPRVEACNAAMLLTPGQDRPAGRYDKQHLVIFGEYVPFRRTFPWLYEKFNSLSPFGGFEYSLDAGSSFTTFEFSAPSLGGRVCRGASPICFEEVMPYVTRNFALPAGAGSERKNIDLLLTISNDGWFLHSSELEQHLASAVFRAVENRVAVCRSVNTGTSGIILPNGRIQRQVHLDERQLGLLDPLEDALREIADRAEAMSQGAGDADVQAIVLAFNPKVIELTDKLGGEFLYLADRLDGLIALLRTAGPKTRPERLAQLTEQVRLDLSTVRRWRQRPWTAPGLCVTPVKCDTRLTVYTRWGDWFPRTLTGLAALALLDWFMRKWRGTRNPNPATEGKQ